MGQHDVLRFNPSPLDVHLVAGDSVMENLGRQAAQVEEQLKVVQLCMMGCGKQVDTGNSIPIEPGLFIAGSRICNPCVEKKIFKQQAERITLY